MNTFVDELIKQGMQVGNAVILFMALSDDQQSSLSEWLAHNGSASEKDILTKAREIHPDDSEVNWDALIGR